MDAIEKSTAKVQEKTELRLAGIEARVADVTAAGSSLGAAVGDQLKASLEQFYKTVDGRFREFAASQAEARRKLDQERATQFQELQGLLAHESPKARAYSGSAHP